MSVRVEVFCRSHDTLSAQDISDFIKHGAYFEEPPRFEPPIDVLDGAPIRWNMLSIFYQNDKRPIAIVRYVNDAVFHEIRQEARVELVARGANIYPGLLNHLVTSWLFLHIPPKWCINKFE